MDKYKYEATLEKMLGNKQEKDGISIPAWPVFWWIILCVGEPDLLDAIVKIIGGY